VNQAADEGATADPGLGPDPGPAASAGADWGVSTLLVVVALAAGLMVLGSLPATTGSVWAALDRLADRQRIPAVKGDAGPLRGVLQMVRRVRGLATSMLGLALKVGSVIGLLALVIWLSDEGWEVLVTHAAEVSEGVMAAALVAVAIGATVSFVLGRQLQVLSRQRTAAGEKWGFQALAHPAGASAGWAVLYGAAYLAPAVLVITHGGWWRSEWSNIGWVSALLGWLPDGSLGFVWVRALVVTSLVLGVLLVLVVPLWLPLKAMGRIADREVQHAMARGSLPTLPPDQETPSDPDKEAQQAAAWDLLGRGVAYRCLVRAPKDARSLFRVWPKDARPLRLRRPMGTRLHKRIQTAHPQGSQSRARRAV
jgi:hypothetical protein